MAISFLEEKTKGKIKFKPDKVFWTLLEAIVVLLLVFVGLKIYNFSLSSHLSSINEEIKKVDAERDLVLENEMQTKIKFFEKVGPLLKSHIRAKKIFDILERDTYSEAQLSNFNFNAESNTLTFSVVSPSAIALAMQVSIFKSDPDVKKVEIGGLSFKEGAIKFQMKVTLNPDVVTY